MIKKQESYLLVMVLFLFVSCDLVSPLGDELFDKNDPVVGKPHDGPETSTPWGAPQDVTVISGFTERIDLNWRAVEGASYYLVSCLEDPFGDFSIPCDEIAQGVNPSKSISWRLIGTEANELVPGSVYYFRIRAVNNQGEIGPYSSVATGALLDIPSMAQPYLQSGEVTLRWSLPNLNIEGVIYDPLFTVFQKNSEGDFFSISSSGHILEGESGYSFSISGVDPHRLYTYKIQVETSGSDSSCSSREIEVLTLDQSYPNQIPDFAATKGSLAGSVDLTWVEPIALAGYEAVEIVYDLTRSLGGEDPELLSGKTTGTTYSDNTAELNMEYLYSVNPYYRYERNGVYVYSTPGESSESVGYRLWKPQDLSIVGDGSDAAVINWFYPPDKMDNVSFRIYREEDMIGSVKDDLTAPLSGKLTDLSFRDETLSNTASYHYSLEAVFDEDGDEEVSDSLWSDGSFSLAVVLETPVSDLSVSEGLADSITISWSGLEDATYNIYRNETGNGYTAENLLVEDLVVDENGLINYRDEGLEAGSVFYYRVESSINSSTMMTDSIRGYTLASPDGVDATKGQYTSKIVLNWNNIDGATAFNVSYRKAGTEDYIIIPNIIPEDLTDPSFEFIPPENSNPEIRGIIWEFAIASVREIEGELIGKSDLSDSISGSTLGPALVDLQATQATFNDRVELSWNAVEGADRYDVYRCDENNPDLATRFLQGIQGISAVDLDTANLVRGGHSWYFIKPLGSGNNSNILSAGVSGCALSPPASILASQGTSSTNINITWESAPGAESYKVYRNNGGDWSEISTIDNGTSYNYPLSDQDLINGDVDFSFIVRSIGESDLMSLDPPEEAEGYALSRPVSVSASKGDLTLQEDGRYYTRVFWPAVKGAERYIVQRNDDRFDEWVDDWHVDWYYAGEVVAGDDSTVEFKDFDALLLGNYEQEYRILTVGRDTSDGEITTDWSVTTTGYRQISPEEFLNIVNYSLRRSMAKSFYASGSSGGGLISESKNGDQSGTYTHGIDRDGFFSTNYRRYYSYSDYKDYFVTLNGSFMKENGGGVADNSRRGDYKHRSSDTAELTITGLNGSELYSGTIKFDNVSIADNNENNPNWDGGQYIVVYNGQTVTFDKTSGIPISYFMNNSTLISKLGY